MSGDFLISDPSQAANSPAAAIVLIAGLVLGAISMAVYKLLAPQQRIDALKLEIAAAQQKLRKYTGTDPKVVMQLTSGAILPALKQFAFVAGPTLVAILPVLLVGGWLEHRYRSLSMWSVGPHWFRSWEVPFTIGLCIAAIVMKFVLKPKKAV